jgi:hypothetical protein
MVVFPLFMLVLSCVCRGFAIAQLAVVVSEVDSEWEKARNANPNVLLSNEKEKERSFLESGQLKPLEIYRTMTLWQKLVKSVDLAQDFFLRRALLFEVLNLRILSQNNH